jgi:hypothetical protein
MVQSANQYINGHLLGEFSSKMRRAPNDDAALGDIEWGPRVNYMGRGIEQAGSGDIVHFWSVYRRVHNCAEWMADFETQKDCELFVRALAKQEASTCC